MDLFNAYIMLSESCNLNCKYCYEFKKDNNHMNMNIVRDTVRFINKSNMKNIVLFGGEPTLNKEGIIYCLENIKPQISITMITNGLFTDDEILNGLKKRENVIVQVSLDGNYASMKNRVDTYEQFQTIVNNSKRYSNFLGKDKLFYHITVTKNNIQNLYESVVFLLGLKTTLNINLTVNINEKYDEIDAIHYRNQLSLIKEYMLKCDEEPIIRPFNSHNAFFKTSTLCGAIDASININSKGDIYPCARLYTNFNDMFKMGDIYSGITKKFIFNDDKGTKCEKCKEKECIRCYAANLELCGVDNQTNPYYCKMQSINNEMKDKYLKQKYNSISNLHGRKIKNIQLILTKNCNFKCKYCFSEHGDKIMHIDDLVKITDLVIRNHDKNTVVNFFGGEPMLEYDNIIVPFMENLISRNYLGKFSIITNGSLLNEEIIDNMISKKMGIMISIDGDYKTFNKNRNESKEIFDKIIKNIKYIISKNYESLEVRMTYREDDIVDLFDNIVFLHNMGIDRIQFYHEYDINIENRKIELEEVFEKIFIYYCKNKSLRMHFIDRLIHYYLNMKDYTRPKNAKCGLIDENSLSFSVNYDGNIFTCHHFNSSNEMFNEFNLGSVKDGINLNKLKELNFEKLKIKNMDSYLRREEICSKCPLVNLCSNICIMQNLSKYGDIFINDEVACEINQIFFKVIDKVLKDLV